MTNIICLINQKGGCGKSSTSFHLGGQLAAEGDRVLLIDADPQGSLSQAFFGSQHVERLSSRETITALFQDSTRVEFGAMIAGTPFSNLDIVPANQLLAPYNTPRPETLGLRQYAFTTLVQQTTAYDWILFDCPPNLYGCSWNALLASEYVLIPVPPEDFGTQGLRAVHQAVESAQQLNSDLRQFGHVITRRDGRLLVHRAYEEKLRQLYTEVYRTTIPEAAAFKVALTCRQPVVHAHPNSKASPALPT